MGQAQYELRSATARFATLGWESEFGSVARGTTAEAEWTFKRSGFFKPKVTVRAHETDVATYHANWNGNGRIELPGGRTWRWKRLAFWLTRYGLVDEAGQPLVEFKAKARKVPLAADTVLSQHALRLPELPLLVVLGWYVMILAFDDTRVVG